MGLRRVRHSVEERFEGGLIAGQGSVGWLNRDSVAQGVSVWQSTLHSWSGVLPTAVSIPTCVDAGEAQHQGDK